MDTFYFNARKENNYYLTFSGNKIRAICLVEYFKLKESFYNLCLVAWRNSKTTGSIYEDIENNPEYISINFRFFIDGNLFWLEQMCESFEIPEYEELFGKIRANLKLSYNRYEYLETMLDIENEVAKHISKYS